MSGVVDWQAASIGPPPVDVGHCRANLLTFGRPVADFQGVQFMLADMAMKLEAARQLTYAAAAKSERAMAGDPDSDLTFFSSACKCLASDAAMDITTALIEMISLTMSRISSRAESGSSWASWARSMVSIRALKMVDLIW